MKFSPRPSLLLRGRKQLVVTGTLAHIHTHGCASLHPREAHGGPRTPLLLGSLPWMPPWGTSTCPSLTSPLGAAGYPGPPCIAPGSWGLALPATLWDQFSRCFLRGHRGPGLFPTPGSVTHRYPQRGRGGCRPQARDARRSPLLSGPTRVVPRVLWVACDPRVAAQGHLRVGYQSPPKEMLFY